MISQDAREIYAWGGNEKGQLGLGHYSEVYEPTRINYFSNRQGKQDLKI